MSNHDRSDLLIVTPPPWGVDTPPLAAACLSSNLTYHGIAVDVFDLNIRLYKRVPDHCRHLWGMEDSHQWHQEESYRAIRARIAPYLEPLVGEIISHPAKHIGFSLPTNCSDYLLVDMIRALRSAAPEKTIILGGVSVSIKPQREALLARLRDDVDYCVVGQGEEVLLEMMKLLISGRKERIRILTGVLTRENRYAEVQVRTVADLDALPFPEFDNVRLLTRQLNRLNSVMPNLIRHPLTTWILAFAGMPAFKYLFAGLISDYNTPGSLVMEFSRGCIGRCPFWAAKTSISKPNHYQHDGFYRPCHRQGIHLQVKRNRDRKERYSHYQ